MSVLRQWVQRSLAHHSFLLFCAGAGLVPASGSSHSLLVGGRPGGGALALMAGSRVGGGDAPGRLARRAAWISCVAVPAGSPRCFNWFFLWSVSIFVTVKKTGQGRTRYQKRACDSLLLLKVRKDAESEAFEPDRCLENSFLKSQRRAEEQTKEDCYRVYQ